MPTCADVNLRVEACAPETVWRCVNLRRCPNASIFQRPSGGIYVWLLTPIFSLSLGADKSAAVWGEQVATYSHTKPQHTSTRVHDTRARHASTTRMHDTLNKPSKVAKPIQTTERLDRGKKCLLWGGMNQWNRCFQHNGILELRLFLLFVNN